MTKSFSVGALDAALDYVASRSDLLSVCAGAPDNLADATTLLSAGGKMLASVPLTEGFDGEDFALAPGLVSGRRLIVAAQTDLLIGDSGTADHVALIDSGGGELLSVTSLTSAQPVTAGTIVSLKSFSEELRSPQ